MRTDSTRVSPAAITDTRAYIEEKYGGDYLPSSPRRFAKKVKGAQEAHEAIRPTSIRREPALIEAYLKKDQLKLYNLIWQRMVSSQMAAAQIDTTTVDIKAKSDKNSYLFKAKRSVVAFPGFFILYQEGKDEDDDENGKAPLPELTKGDVLKLQRLLPEQRFTQPPLRYSEATLVKVLEELGIGRPSTYAPILSLIQERGYVERANGKLLPTELGAIVSGLLSEHFADIVNVGFTAQMEEKLDQIASGQLEWVPMLKEFYNPFEELVVRATSTIPKVSQQTDEVCDICGRPMVIKWGRRGKFLSCSGFPECKNAKPIIVTAGANCPQCGAEMLERRSKKGKLFYGCSQFPKCKFATWDKPLTQPCPQCQGLLTASKKGTAKCTQCEYEGELGSVE
ncbi:MAG: type I DNA topoisomerase, partial [Dehalococcoidia bacterium]